MHARPDAPCWFSACAQAVITSRSSGSSSTDISNAATAPGQVTCTGEAPARLRNAHPHSPDPRSATMQQVLRAPSRPHPSRGAPSRGSCAPRGCSARATAPSRMPPSPRPVAALHERRAEVRVGAAVRGIELDGLPQFGNRGGEIRCCGRARHRASCAPRPTGGASSTARRNAASARGLSSWRMFARHSRAARAASDSAGPSAAAFEAPGLPRRRSPCLRSGRRIERAPAGPSAAADAGSPRAAGGAPRSAPARACAIPTRTSLTQSWRHRLPTPPVSAEIHGCHRSGSNNRFCSRDEASSTSRRVLA